MPPQIRAAPQGWAQGHPGGTVWSRGLVPAVPTPLTHACPARRVPRGCRRRRPEGREVSKDVKNVLPRRRMLNRSWERGLRGRRARRGVPGPGGCFPSARIAVPSCTETSSPLPGACVRGHVRDGQSIPAAYRGCNRGGASLAKEPELLSAFWMSSPAAKKISLSAALVSPHIGSEYSSGDL